MFVEASSGELSPIPGGSKELCHSALCHRLWSIPTHCLASETVNEISAFGSFSDFRIRAMPLSPNLTSTSVIKIDSSLFLILTEV